MNKGTLKSYTYDGTTTNYSYDGATDRLEAVSVNTSNGLVANLYDYNEDGYLESISHNGFEYGFTYDEFGKTLSTSVGDRTLMTHTYSAGNGKVIQSNYGNGSSYTNQYDTLGNVVGVRYNGVQQFTWKMNAKGQTIEHEDLSNEKRYYYEYDSTGRGTRTTVFDTQTGSRIQEHEYKYDLNNNISKYVSVIEGTPYVTQFEYGKDNLLTKTVLSSNVEITNTYDGLNRLTETELGTQTPKTTTYEYYAPKVSQNGSNTTTQLKSETIDGVKYEYVYDDRGNIAEIYKGNTLVSAYEYDELSQLILEYDAVRGTETYYTYDNGGNILNRTVLDAETYELLDDVNYEYGDESWKDLLTEYDGSAITYDQIGNPLSYRGYTMTWQRGRQLATLNGNGVSATYQYDSDGLRNTKTVNGVTHEYYYDGTSLIAEKRGSDMIVWNGSGFILNGTYYYYKTNTRGDVIGLYDANGTQICEYEYDAWGKLLSVTDMEGNAITSATHPANINPIRYRSYYYDVETGLYYLQSRYYDPETGRFLNADGVTDGGAGIIGNNLFAYVANNPVNNTDETGRWIIKNAIKWLAKNVVKPVVKTVQKVLSKINMTYSKGININGSTGFWNFSGQGGISVDTKGNVAIQGSFSGGATSGTPGISFTGYRTVTNASNIKKLEGPSYQIGGSVGVPIYGVPITAGGDFNIVPDNKSNKTYFGITNNVGFGTPGREFHIDWGETSTIKGSGFNIFTLAKIIYKKIMEW